MLDKLEDEPAPLTWPALLSAGAIAGIAGWLATFFFDVVKTRVQSVDYQPLVKHTESVLSKTVAKLPIQNESYSTMSLPVQCKPYGQALHPYQTTLSTIINSYRAEGITVFFRGLSPTLIRFVCLQSSYNH